jgi:hypothetical protein
MRTPAALQGDRRNTIPFDVGVRSPEVVLCLHDFPHCVTGVNASLQKSPFGFVQLQLLPPNLCSRVHDITPSFESSIAAHKSVSVVSSLHDNSCKNVTFCKYV